MKFFNLLIVSSLLLLSGCMSTNQDQITMLMLTNRLKQLEESKKLETQKVLVEIEISNDQESSIINMDRTPRKVTIEAILDEDGRVILPADKIIRKFELKNVK